ncbi:MAG: helix-turn-helix transcriptional regulator [Nocardioidaceae bacterium]|nr:helix-turn-helix transcriptional regulator [Nocardioidaceae bacterium]
METFGPAYVEQPCDLPDAFRCVWVRRGSLAPGAGATVLPDACTDIVVDATGTAVVVGPTMTPHRLALLPAVTFRGLRLQPWSIPLLFRTTAADLRDRVLPLQDLVAPRVAEEVAAAVWAGQVPRCWSSIDTSPWQMSLVKGLLHAPSGGVERTGWSTGVSERQARRTTRELTGLSPRELAHVGRLTRVVSLIDRPGRSLASIAVQSGYSDQAHLTRDLKQLTGVTPRALRVERADPALWTQDRTVASARDLVTHH